MIFHLENGNLYRWFNMINMYFLPITDYFLQNEY